MNKQFTANQNKTKNGKNIVLCMNSLMKTSVFWSVTLERSQENPTFPSEWHVLTIVYKTNVRVCLTGTGPGNHMKSEPLQCPT